MVAIKKKRFGTCIKIAVVLLLAAFVIGAYVWVNAGTGNSVSSGNYNQIRNQDNPEAAVNILANGDVAGRLSNIVEHQGNVYTLTADLNQELVISRSNIVFDGKGFTIGMKNTASNHQTIALSSVKNVTIQDVNIIGEYFAISFLHAQNNTIQNVTGGTINLYDSANNIITKSTASFTFQAANYNVVKNCVTGGFEFSSSNNNLILNNNCTDSGRALYFADASNNLVFGNTFKQFWWWISMYGSSSNNSIVGNEIRTRQLYLADSFVGTNYIYGNNFFDFKWNYTATNSANIWSENGQGNYWSDYNGTDANHDGMGDTPYTLDANNIDKYPLMNPVDIMSEQLPALNK